MKAQELLQFIPGPEEKFMTTSKIAMAAKINHRTAKVFLMELLHSPRPLVEMFEFGKGRPYNIWKRTTIRTNLIEIYLKIEPINRSGAEHKVLCQDKYGGDWHQYINSFLEKKE